MFVPKPARGNDIKNVSDNILKGKTWRVSEKIDAVRRLFYKDKKNKVRAFTSSGIEDQWVGHITSFLKHNKFQKNRVYDCELVDRVLYFAKAPSFILRTESASKASQQYDTNKKDLMAICFDVYDPDAEFDGWFRDGELKSIFTRGVLSDPIIQVPIFGNVHGEDRETIDSLMSMVELYGGEGLMLMNLDSPYICGTSNNLVKVKHIEEYLGTVVDAEIAKQGTKIEGGVATLVCMVDGCTVPVRVGSGLTHAQRVEIAKNFKTYIGRKIEIEAFSKTRDSNGNISLSCPVFKRFIKWKEE